MRELSLFRLARKYIIIYLCIFPFFLTDTYYNITVSKCAFFILISLCFFVLSFIKELNLVKSLRKLTVFKIENNSDIMVCVLFFVVFCSTLSSQSKSAALLGDKGRYMGFLIWIALFLAYFCISKFYFLRNKELLFFQISFSVMCCFSTLQFMGYDPFHMFTGVDYTTEKTFIGFIGNINVFASYVCLGLPYVMYQYCFDKCNSRCRYFIHVFSCFAGILGLFCTNSDCGYLGVGIALIMLLFKTMERKETFINYISMLILFFSTAGIFKVLHSFHLENARHLTFLSRFITDSRFLVISILFLIVSKNLIKRSEISSDNIKRIKKILFLFMLITVLLLVFLLLWFSLIDKKMNLGLLENYLRFNNNWGSDRGYIWKTIFKIYRDLPLCQKLIGLGPDTLAVELQKNYRVDMQSTMGFFYDNAHNEVLQYLVTIGLWGTIVYLCLVFCTIRECEKSNDYNKKALAISIVAYLVQSLVNIHQPITTPLFFVFLALAQCETYNCKIIQNPKKEIEFMEEL